MRILAILYILTSGCGMGYETKPEQVAVTAIVWNQAYNMTDEPPQIEWIDQKYLTCAAGTGFKTSYTEEKMSVYGCVSGVTYIDIWLSKIAWPAGAKYSSTSFSHELCHSMMYITTGDGDPDHLGPCFTYPDGYVYKVNAILMDVGL